MIRAPRRLAQLLILGTAREQQHLSITGQAPDSGGSDLTRSVVALGAARAAGCWVPAR